MRGLEYLYLSRLIRLEVCNNLKLPILYAQDSQTPVLLVQRSLACWAFVSERRSRGRLFGAAQLLARSPGRHCSSGFRSSFAAHRDK